MTKNQAKKQLKEMLKDLDILKECERLLNAGAIEISNDSKDDYSHTKVVLKVALENVTNEILIYSNEIKKDYTNLKRF